MEKEILRSALIKQVTIERDLQKKIVDDTKAMQIHSDLKSEGKYDTRAIEASYLADGQRKRLEELELDLQMLEDVPLESSESIQIGALACLSHKDVDRWYYFTPNCGGTMLDLSGKPVLVISVFSPLGNEAVGLTAGEEFVVETPREERAYRIKSIF